MALRGTLGEKRLGDELPVDPVLGKRHVDAGRRENALAAVEIDERKAALVVERRDLACYLVLKVRRLVYVAAVASELRHVEYAANLAARMRDGVRLPRAAPYASEFPWALTRVRLIAEKLSPELQDASLRGQHGALRILEHFDFGNVALRGDRTGERKSALDPKTRICGTLHVSALHADVRLQDMKPNLESRGPALRNRRLDVGDAVRPLVVPYVVVAAVQVGALLLEKALVVRMEKLYPALLRHCDRVVDSRGRKVLQVHLRAVDDGGTPAPYAARQAEVAFHCVNAVENRLSRVGGNHDRDTAQLDGIVGCGPGQPASCTDFAVDLRLRCRRHQCDGRLFVPCAVHDYAEVLARPERKLDDAELRHRRPVHEFVHAVRLESPQCERHVVVRHLDVDYRLVGIARRVGYSIEAKDKSAVPLLDGVGPVHRSLVRPDELDLVSEGPVLHGLAERHALVPRNALLARGFDLERANLPVGRYGK